jgi:hypothetical protein
VENSDDCTKNPVPPPKTKCVHLVLAERRDNALDFFAFYIHSRVSDALILCVLLEKLFYFLLKIIALIC